MIGIDHILALPVIGGFIGAGVAVFLGLLETPVAVGLMLVSFVLVQQVETHILTPRMMSNSVQHQPDLVIVSLFIGFAVGGVIGGLIAVPVAGTLMVLARHLIIGAAEAAAGRAAALKGGGILIAGGRYPVGPGGSQRHRQRFISHSNNRARGSLARLTSKIPVSTTLFPFT